MEKDKTKAIKWYNIIFYGTLKQKILITIIGFIVSVVILGIILCQIVIVGVDTFYSTSYVAESVEMAKKQGVFVSQPHLETPEIEVNGVKYLIDEIWIQNIIRVEYKMLFFRRKIPIGYRLGVRLKDISNPISKKNLVKNGFILMDNLVCNESIRFTSSTGNIFFCEIKEPLPTTIGCIFENKSESK